MYKTSVKIQSGRSLIITDAVKASDKKMPFYEYQNTKTELPIIRIDLSIPIYRMENYRTRTAQLRYIHANNHEEEFFRNGGEDEAAQQAQHEILIGFAKKGKGNSSSVVPILDELQRSEQQEPLLITDDGVVVNGNRRLTAMRELWSSDPEQFKHFKYIDCAVLPSNITPEELREIEVRLQMQPQTKLPYGWVDESIAVNEMLSSGKSVDYVAGLMKMRRKDVEIMARALVEVDIYLKEWLCQPGEYQLVEDAKQFFQDMAKSFAGKQGEDLEASRRIAWSLVSSSKNLSRRVYDYNFGFDKRSEEVVAAVCDRLDIDFDETETEEDLPDLDIDFGQDVEQCSTLGRFVELFDNERSRGAAIDELIAVCESIWEQDRQGAIGRRALGAIQSANSKLQEVDLSKADGDSFSDMLQQLKSISKRAEHLMAEVEKGLDP